MVPRTWRANPWSVLLVLVGLAFTLTASAYAVMAVRKLDASRALQGGDPNPWLIEFLDRHGAELMVAELAALAIVVAAAIASDRWRSGRRKPQPKHHSEEDTPQRCRDPGGRGT